MSKRILVAVVGLLVGTYSMASAAPARATRNSSGDWSIVAGDTVTPGSDVIYGAAGFPDFSFGWAHGISPTFDAGLKLRLIYGIEHTTNTQFGFGFGAPLRWQLTRGPSLAILFHVEPGIRLYTTDPVAFGFAAPFGFNLEFLTRAPFEFGVGIDWNNTLRVTNGAAYVFGPLVGPFMEYHIDRDLVVGLDTRFGVIISAASGGTATNFGFRTQAVLAYRL
jgi:hypothetical protein